MKSFRSGTIVTAVILAAIGGWGAFTSSRRALQISRLERERDQLVEYAERLGASHRVAQVRVIEQYVDDQGRRVNQLLWHEIRPDGIIGIPIEVTVFGEIAYFEALTIKFERRFVEQGDPERGVSLALFRRIFGDEQAPESVPFFDQPGPTYGQAGGPEGKNRPLWDRFWELVEDPELAEAYGVRVAQIEAPAVPLRPGQVWQITLDAAGGLNVKLVQKASGAPQ